MEHRPYVSHLRYLDADDVGKSPVDFSSLEVRDHEGDKLGNLDGFIVDTSNSRVLHTVVDSGGWFRSRRFLVPIGHTTISSDQKALTLDVRKDTLRDFPEFHEDRFRTFDDEDLRAFERQTLAACCPDDVPSESPTGNWNYESRHYQAPTWWSGYTRPERFRPIESRPFSGVRGSVDTLAAPGAFERELVIAREEGSHDVRGHHDDGSPHPGGRAQPGDVLGVETGGERSHLGDTAEEEDKRRRTAERSVSKDER